MLSKWSEITNPIVFPLSHRHLSMMGTHGRGQVKTLMDAEQKQHTKRVAAEAKEKKAAVKSAQMQAQLAKQETKHEALQVWLKMLVFFCAVHHSFAFALTLEGHDDNKHFDKRPAPTTLMKE